MKKMALALAALMVLFMTGTACKASSKSEAPAAPEAKAEALLSIDQMIPVFGDAKDAASGLADFTQSDAEIILSYHFYPADPTNADLEIARDLAPKIRKLYGHFPSVDRAKFDISLPDPSSPDDWKPYVSFALTRKIVKEVGWSDVLDTDLLSAAIEVRKAE